MSHVSGNSDEFFLEAPALALANPQSSRQDLLAAQSNLMRSYSEQPSLDQLLTVMPEGSANSEPGWSQSVFQTWAQA
ncbi:MAG: hypothetical protein HC800_03165 [Phormidesmis sp. RL_2_1]|nr:hypothetical protein [Phormidesmis sp. RL_2_1]